MIDILATVFAYTAIGIALMGIIAVSLVLIFGDRK